MAPATGAATYISITGGQIERDNNYEYVVENMNAFRASIKLLQLLSFRSLVGFLLLLAPMLGLLLYAGL